MAQADVGSRRLGRYRLVERLGAGGMAEVFRAVVDGPAGFARSVVIKRVLPDDAPLQPAARDALIAEARVCSLLHHPNIVQVYELGEDAGEYFLVMELVDGIDVGRLLRKCIATDVRVPVGVALFVVAEVARALAYVHALTDEGGRPLGLIHRDVSPSNVIIARSGGVKLLDFGIAKLAMADERTRTGTLKGKIPYMSPEQADGRPLDHRSDIFSLGVVLWECLTSARLFPRDNELATLRMVRQAEVRPPSTVRPDLSPAIDRVVMRMLARSVADRPATCELLLGELQPLVRAHDGDALAVRRFIAESMARAQPDEVAAEAPVAAEPASLAEAAASDLPPPSQTRAPTVPFAAPARSRRWLAAAAAAIVVGGAGAWLAVRPRAHPPAKVVTTAALPPPPTAPAAATVQLRVVGQAHARVRIDGRDVGELPLALELPAQPSARDVVVSAPGFAAWRQRIPGDANSTLAVRLDPVARALRGRHKTRAAGGKPPAGFDPESAVPPK